MDPNAKTQLLLRGEKTGRVESSAGRRCATRRERLAGSVQPPVQKPCTAGAQEVPAENVIDPTAIDLTPLVNTLINSSQSGSRQLFSLLSVTSYSSLDLHKLTLLVYNISSIRSLESGLFRRRFCYCVTNETNDLTDFTAVLLDVMGNSTSYLHELFKSSSILSVSQRNNSDCIYICVMAGKMGREVSVLWDVGSITPLFNQTIVEGPHKVTNISSIRLPVEWHQLPTNLGHVSPSGMSSMLTSRVSSTAHASPHLSRTSSTALKVTASKAVTMPQYPRSSMSPGVDCCNSSAYTPTSYIHNSPLSTEQPAEMTPSSRATAANQSRETEKPGCPWRRPEPSGKTKTISELKLQPCVLELCKFFSQCLCRPLSRKTRMKRYCEDSFLWYKEHTFEVCQRVKRISFSRNLKQRCLSKMCNKL
ncbi:HERV-H LTR-associating protein 1 [Anableps anableps]